MSIDDDLTFAHRLADAAGAVIRPYFRKRIDVVDKGEAVFDPVTAADKGAEEAIRTLIKAERPEDGILGEEYGELHGVSGRTWVIDPVDGTRAFITGQTTGGFPTGPRANPAHSFPDGPIRHSAPARLRSITPPVAPQDLCRRRFQ